MTQRSEHRGWKTANDCLALTLICLSFFLYLPPSAHAALPITTDSRIKTFVYNENEVFNIVTHYGYQSNIELAENEEIMTVSIGDRVGWQIVPAGRRIFIRAMEDRAHTNMTVVTNKRAYQFDIREAGQAPLMSGEELVYVVRFYYPDEPGLSPPPPVVSAAAIARPPVVMTPPPPMATNTPTYTPPVPMIAPAPVSQSMVRPMNYNYTFSGPSSAAPSKIYDDGKATYFKFPATGPRPNVSVLTTSGQEMPVSTSLTPDGMVVVNVVAPRFTLTSEGARVVIYNEALPGA